MDNQKFTVSMCVYGKDNPEWFDRAIESVTILQTVKPNEVVLVVDGPVPDIIEEVIKKYSSILDNKNIHFKIIRFEENQGHGNARRASVDNASNEIIALMDADDVSLPDRFEKQFNLMIETKANVVGGNISEFIGEESNIVAYRTVPSTDSKIKEYAKSRCPMNQVTVMFTKSSYYDAGGYIDWFWEEDYYLWLRMILKNMVFANSNCILVNVRVGKDMYKRRGGLKYYLSERKIQMFMLKNHMIGYVKYMTNCLKRFIVQVLMTNNVREFVFKKFARSRNNEKI